MSMKKTGLLIITAVIVVFVLGCKKKYNCSCMTANGGYETKVVKAKNPEDAELACLAKSTGTNEICDLE